MNVRAAVRALRELAQHGDRPVEISGGDRVLAVLGRGLQVLGPPSTSPRSRCRTGSQTRPTRPPGTGQEARQREKDRNASKADYHPAFAAAVGHVFPASRQEDEMTSDGRHGWRGGVRAVGDLQRGADADRRGHPRAGHHGGAGWNGLLTESGERPWRGKGSTARCASCQRDVEGEL